MDIQVRKARLIDESLLKLLARRTIESCYPFFLGAASVRGYLDTGGPEHFIDDCLHRSLVILDSQLIVGVGAYQDDLLELLMIDADRHGKGYGSILLEHLEREMSLKHEEIRLESFRNNTRANGFFEARGWVRSRVFDSEGVGAQMVEYRKRIGD